MAKATSRRVSFHACQSMSVTSNRSAPLAGVFFKKPEAKSDILNHLDNKIVNIYWAIQRDPDQFLKQFKTLFVSQK